jgi:hypothetical protein
MMEKVHSSGDAEKAHTHHDGENVEGNEVSGDWIPRTRSAYLMASS